jgi:hypothetical protein
MGSGVPGFDEAQSLCSLRSDTRPMSSIEGHARLAVASRVAVGR